MILINILDITLPLANPVLKFLLILLIILFAPIVFNKIKVPALLGLIIAGAIIGPNGFHLMDRDSSIILSGTAGLLYIMFLAGLEIDLVDFKKNSFKSVIFGLYTFIIPMVLGITAGIYILGFSVPTSVLLASMFASHTLIAYPIISKLGVAKNRAVNITVGGTMITDTLALIVLAVIVGMSTGEVGAGFWLKLSLSIIASGLIIILVFPIVARWFFKRYNDNVSQYIFVLVMVFLGAVLAEIAGVEPIIGAFLSGLSLNRLIPRTSPLMNRVEFVGNAIFIPFFLIGVGMLIDYKAFYTDIDTIIVALVMTSIATLAKFIAAWLTQKTFKLTLDERRLVFGLSNAQAAATLAAVLVGYNIITGYSDSGDPVRLLNESVLNGTILMILITCTIASLVAQKGAKNMAITDVSSDSDIDLQEEKILIPISNIETTDELIQLSVTIKSGQNKKGLYALKIIDSKSPNPKIDKNARELLYKAAVTAGATDNHLNELLRYDSNITNGIASVVKEQGITDLILGLHEKRNISDSFLGDLTEGLLQQCDTTTLIYKATQPLPTIKRHLVIIPRNAEKEIGFPFWILKVWNIARNSGDKIIFYAENETINYLKSAQLKHPIDCEFIHFSQWDNFLSLKRDLKKEDNLIIVLSRKDHVSYNKYMDLISIYLNKYFNDNSFILIYPLQINTENNVVIDFKNPSFIKPAETLDEFNKIIAGLFKKK